jgi:hypothetical protein
LITKEESVVLVKWFDNKPVYIASNFIGIGELKKVNRWDKVKKQYVQIDIPEIVAKYNQNMGGVDFLDQMIGYYRVFIKSNKWPLRVFSHFLDFALVSAYFEYKNAMIAAGKANNQILDLMNFRLYVANCLIKIDQPTKVRGRPLNIAETPPTKRSKCEVRPITLLKLNSEKRFIFSL